MRRCGAPPSCWPPPSFAAPAAPAPTPGPLARAESSSGARTTRGARPLLARGHRSEPGQRPGPREPRPGAALPGQDARGGGRGPSGGGLRAPEPRGPLHLRPDPRGRGPPRRGGAGVRKGRRAQARRGRPVRGPGRRVRRRRRRTRGRPLREAPRPATRGARVRASWRSTSGASASTIEGNAVTAAGGRGLSGERRPSASLRPRARFEQERFAGCRRAARARPRARSQRCRDLRPARPTPSSVGRPQDAARAAFEARSGSTRPRLAFGSTWAVSCSRRPRRRGPPPARGGGAADARDAATSSSSWAGPSRPPAGSRRPRQAYRRAIALSPRLVSPRYALGRLLLRQGRRRRRPRRSSRSITPSTSGGPRAVRDGVRRGAARSSWPGRARPRRGGRRSRRASSRCRRAPRSCRPPPGRSRASGGTPRPCACSSVPATLAPDDVRIELLLVDRASRAEEAK